MNQPRLGNCIIINNVSSQLPRSDVDVEAMKSSCETVGLDVYVYRDCDKQVG